MDSGADSLPDDPVLLKQLLLSVRERVLLRKKPPKTRKPLPANLPHVEVIHELPEHELTCACGCQKQAIGKAVSEQLDIVPMQIRVICHLRKTYACKACEMAPVTAAKPAQPIEKSLASPGVLAMLLTTKYVDGLPLHRFERVLIRHGTDISRQTLARWAIRCAGQMQPLLNLLRDWLLESPVIHCDETRVQVSGIPPASPGCECKQAVRRRGGSSFSTTAPAGRRRCRCACSKATAAT